MEEGKTNVDEWVKRLTKGYEEACVRTKALVRKREIKTPADVENVQCVLSNHRAAAEMVSLYRYRWQVEIYFKRLKSILDFGHVPLRREDSIHAWVKWGNS